MVHWRGVRSGVPLPNEVFQLGLTANDLLVYIYLQYQKGVHSGQCYPSYATIGAAVSMTRKTVQKHVWSLVDKGLIQVENTTVRWKDGRTRNGNLLYTITPIDQVLKEREKELLGQLKLAEIQRKWDERVKRITARQTAHTEKLPRLISKGIWPSPGGSSHPSENTMGKSSASADQEQLQTEKPLFRVVSPFMPILSGR